MMILTLFWGCTDPCLSEGEHLSSEDVSIGDRSWTRTTISEGICGSAFISSADVNGDSEPELLVANFGRPDGISLPMGHISMFSFGSSVQEYEYTEPLSAEDEYRWPNDIEAHDLDEDGDLDLIVGSGFLTCQLSPWSAPCGSLIWLENRSDGSDWQVHEIVSKGDDLFFHKPLVEDFNSDGFLDIIAVGESYKTPIKGDYDAQVLLFLGTDIGSFSEPIFLAQGLGSIPQIWDVDQDGDLDVVSGEYFANLEASYVWLEQIEPPSEQSPGGIWERHIIDDSVGPTIQFLMVEDLLGDGVARAIGSNHSNTQSSSPDPWTSSIIVYTPTDNPKDRWEKTPIYEGFVSVPSSNQAAPGVFDVGDVGQDGDWDILVSGDGDPKVVLLEQEEGMFVPHIVSEDMPQAGVHLTDLQSDGRLELVVGSYEKNLIYVYEEQ